MKIHLRILARLQDAWSYRSEPEETTLLASLYWRALLVVAAIICVCVLGFGGFELSAVTQSENAAPPSIPAGSAAINKAQLESTLGAFTQKQSNYQSLSQSPVPPVADPSQ